MSFSDTIKGITKSRFFEYVQTYRFHAFDLSIPIPTITLFTPTFGFNSINTPSISLEQETVTEGCFEFERKFITGAVVDDITFTRGVKVIDSDFWRWVVNSINGYDGGDIGRFMGYKLRRDILLVAFTGKAWSSEISSVGIGGINLQSLGLANIPAKAWVLRNCLPREYKTAGDFSADSDDISLSELTISFEFFEEWGLI